MADIILKNANKLGRIKYLGKIQNFNLPREIKLINGT